MSNVIKVSSNQIISDADKIKNLSDSIPTLINELQEVMNRLSGCWEGPAWEAYQGTVATYIQILTRNYEMMGKFVADLYDASENYKKVEQEIFKIVK